MLEITFSESAHGFLRISKGFAKREILCFPLMWSIGDISDSTPGQARRDVLHRMCTFDLDECREQIDRQMKEAAASYQTLLERAAEGEAVRVWYSRQPDELCGFYWLMAQLDGMPDCPVSAAKLPLYVETGKDELVAHNCWGEVSPEECLIPQEQAVSLNVRRSAARHWQELQEENAPLRAEINRRLVSVPEDFYDCFIRTELPQMGEAFLQGRLIGRVMSRNQMGLHGGLLPERIDAMVQTGELEIIKAAPEDCPSDSRRILRKR